MSIARLVMRRKCEGTLQELQILPLLSAPSWQGKPLHPLCDASQNINLIHAFQKCLSAPIRLLKMYSNTYVSIWKNSFDRKRKTNIVKFLGSYG